jgi:hypothetical protein
MKKFTLLLTVLSVIFLFASCSKDHGSSLKVKGEIKNGTYNATCTNVRAIAEDANSTEIARGDFSKGSFSLTLPKEVPSSILTKINFDDITSEFVGNADLELTVSNPDTKGVTVYFEAYNGNEALDELIYAAQSTEGSIFSLPYILNYTISSYFYADSKCTVKGSASDPNMPVTTDIDFTLYKGWTRIYFTIGTSISLTSNSLKVSVTNAAPKNANMAWYFSEDFSTSGIGFAPNSLSTEQQTIIKNFFNKVR